MKKEKNKLNEIYDKEDDPIKWIDLIMFRCWLMGKEGQNLPVDWARERMTKFIKKPTKVEFYEKGKINKYNR